MFYYLGAYLYECEKKITFKGLTVCSGLYIACYIFSQMFSNETSFALKVITLLAGSIGSLAGVLVIYGSANLIGSRKKNSAIWNILKKNSFGIYLFHQQLIYPCIMLLNGRVISFIIAICGACIITEFLRKHKLTKMLFGI